MDDARDRRTFRRETEIRAETGVEMPAPRRNDVRCEGEERSMTGEKKKMNVISFDRSKKIPDAARIAEFAATARKLLRERSAGEVVAKLLKETPREEWASLAEREEIRNSGALERLSREIASALEKEPTDALAMSGLATTIAETLPADDYPPIVTAQMRAHAWKDRAQALSYVGRDAQALQAIDHAAPPPDP